MAPWFLLALGAFFAYLALDAARPLAPRRDLVLPADLRPPVIEEPRIKAFHLRHGLGNVNQAMWLFAILSIVFAGCGLWALSE